MLHITNGESGVSTFRAGGLPGEYLSWLDVLHDGPVPAVDSLEELSEVRARYIASVGWAPLETVIASFAKRDSALRRFREHDEVVLWFEHDLFDQLQMIQLLHFFSNQQLGKTRLSLINIGSFPGHEHFLGLGELSGAELMTLFPKRKPVTPEQLSVGACAWQAFTCPDPSALVDVTQSDTIVHPFLHAAVIRLLEEYPSIENGLARSEHQLLRCIDEGKEHRQAAFLGVMEMEEAPFMSDSSAFLRLEALAAAPCPALARMPGGETYQLTDFGRQLLEGSADWVTSQPEPGRTPERWIGGVPLFRGGKYWRWNGVREALEPESLSV